MGSINVVLTTPLYNRSIISRATCLLFFLGTLILVSLVCLDKLIDTWIGRNMMDGKLRYHMRDITLAKHKHSHIRRNKNESLKRDSSGESLLQYSVNFFQQNWRQEVYN